MKEEEYKTRLLELGLSEEKIPNINFSQLEDIISHAKNIDEIICAVIFKASAYGYTCCAVR